MARKMTELDLILKLTPEQRKRRKLYTSLRKRKRGKNCRGWDRDGMIQFLRDNEIRTTIRLDEVRKELRTGPCLDMYRRKFGNWEEATKIAFGVGTAPKRNKAPVDDEYVIKLMVEFNISTIEKYRKLQKEKPLVFPSIFCIRKKWGTFNNLKHTARLMSLRASTDDYIKLGQNLGRWPTIGDCREYKINIDKLLEVFGSIRDLQEYMGRMAELVKRTERKENEVRTGN